MSKLKVLLASGLVVSSCLLSAIPALADTTTPAPSTNPNAPYLTQLKTLRATEQGIQQNIASLNSAIGQQSKTDRQQKNFSAIIAADNVRLNTLSDFNAARAASVATSKDNAQLQMDRAAKNTAAVTTDLQTLITDLQTRINADTQLASDKQAILTALGGSVQTSSTPVQGQ